MDKARLRRLIMAIAVIVPLVVAGFILGLLTKGPAGQEGAMGAFSGHSDLPACDFASWIGHPVDEQALHATGREVRIMAPGTAATMDYLPERINVMTNDDGIVLNVTCG